MRDTTIYKSKIDTWLIVVLCASFALAIAPIFFDFSLTAFVISLALAITVLFMVFDMRYIIVDEELKIKGFWFIPFGNINIKKIKTVKTTKTTLSSPALSLDRIEIIVDNKHKYVISPKYKQQFADELLRINPKIEVKI